MAGTIPFGNANGWPTMQQGMPASDRSCVCSHGRIAGSIMRGSFRNVQVTASGTGTLVVTSATPAQVTADVSGITTLLLDVPAGEWEQLQQGCGAAAEPACAESAEKVRLFSTAVCQCPWVEHQKLKLVAGNLMVSLCQTPEAAPPSLFRTLSLQLLQDRPSTVLLMAWQRCSTHPAPATYSQR